MTASWLTVVGIGADGPGGLGGAARAALGDAALIVGGARHLSLLPGDARPRLPWRSPLEATLDEVAAWRGRLVAVLASGDPSWFGVAKLLRRRFGDDAVRVVPQVSSLQLAAARLGWSLEETTAVSLHGRPLHVLNRWLQPGRRLLVLTTDGGTPAEVAARLRACGFGDSRLVVLENLGGADERVRSMTAAELAGGQMAELNVVALDLVAGAAAKPRPLVPGLPDDAFLHDGQLTKAEIRAITLASLAPMPGALLWDVGAGAGSVAIEWLRAGCGARAIAVERRPDRARRLRANAASLGTPDLEVVEGTAPACLEPLAAPDAVFVGGGTAEPGLLETCFTALRPGGRLVANAVTLAGEEALLASRARPDARLRRIAIERADTLGDDLVWRPALPVTQLVLRKPCDAAG